MRFKRILSKNKIFEELWKLYHYSFPKDEKKSKKQILNALKKKEYSFLAIYDKKLIGLLSLWKFRDFSFIEYFAVFPKFRNQGYGRKIIKELPKRKYILEIEPPIDKITIRRVNFYKKLGYKLNKFKYTQPSLGKNKKPFPARIMSYPGKLSLQEFQKVKNTLYKEAYNENIRN